MKRIAFIINSLSNGGAERTISNITTHLSEEYEVDIIVNEEGDVTYPVNGRIISLGFKRKSDKMSFTYQIKSFLRRLRVLKNLKKENCYSAVISFSESASIANILSGNRYCKVVVSVRICLSKCTNNSLYKFIGFPAVRMLYNRADKVVAVSEGVRIDLIDNFGINPEKVITISNGCDVQKIKEKTMQEIGSDILHLFDGKKIIATMGRLEYQKGQWHLIRAIRKVIDDGYDIKLIILGQGKMQDYLEKVVKDNELEGRVEFLGFQENPFSILSRSDLYVLPSLFEGMSNSLLEAMACGLPCISTDHPSGAREIIAPGTVLGSSISGIEYAEFGVLIPVCEGDDSTKNLSNEEQLMSSAIEVLLSNHEIYMKYKERSFERATSMSIEERTQRWVDEIN